MARLRLEYKSEPEKGEPFIKAEGYIEVMYNSELEEMKAKLLALFFITSLLYILPQPFRIVVFNPVFYNLTKRYIQTIIR